MEMNHLFHIDCFINCMHVYYDFLPNFKSGDYTRTVVNFSFLDQSKLEVDEESFSKKNLNTTIVFEKGSSCLFALRQEQLTEFYPNLTVTVEVRDEVHGRKETLQVATQNFNLKLNSADTRGGIQDSNSEVARVDNFFLKNKKDQIIVYIEGFLRITLLGQFIETNFFWSEAEKQLMYHKKGSGEKMTLLRKNHPDQIELIKQLSGKFSSQDSRRVDLEVWDSRCERDTALYSKTVDKDSSTTKTTKPNLETKTTGNVREENNVEKNQRSSNWLESKQREPGNKNPPEKKADEFDCFSKISSVSDAGTRLRKLMQEIKSQSTDCAVSKLVEQLSNQSEQRSTHVNNEKTDALNTNSNLLSEFPSEASSNFKTFSIESTKLRSSINSSTNNTESTSQKDTLNILSCPCSLKEDQPTAPYSCVCTNTHLNAQRVGIDTVTAADQTVASEFQSCSCTVSAKGCTGGNPMIVIKPELNFNSCPCPAHDDLTNLPITSLQACACTIKSADPILETVQMDSTLYTCPCAKQTEDHKHKFSVATPHHHAGFLQNECIKQTEDHRNKLLVATPHHYAGFLQNDCIKQTEDHRNKLLVATPHHHTASPQNECMKQTEDHKNKLLVAAPHHHSAFPQNECMKQTADWKNKTSAIAPHHHNGFLRGERARNTHIRINPNVAYSCPCMLTQSATGLNDLKEDAAYSCVCMRRSMDNIDHPIKERADNYSCPCMIRSDTDDEHTEKTRKIRKNLQVNDNACGCKEATKNSAVRGSNTDDRKKDQQCRMYNDNSHQHCGKEVNESFETRIKELLEDEYNIFIPENAIRSNAVSPALILNQIQRHEERGTDFCNQRQPSKKSAKESVPILELPFNSKTDIYLLKINRQTGGKLSEVKESGMKVPSDISHQLKREAAINRDLDQTGHNMNTLQVPARRQHTKLSPKTSLIKKSRPCRNND